MVSSAIDHLSLAQLRDPKHFKSHYMGLSFDLGFIREELKVRFCKELSDFHRMASKIVNHGFNSPLVFNGTSYDLNVNPKDYAMLYDSLWIKSTKYLHDILER